MKLFEMPPDPQLLSLGERLFSQLDEKYRAAFEVFSDDDRAKLALYFLPHGSKKETLSVSRPRVLKWYGPFADQRVFPSGARYSLNVYTGCEHACRYCYVNGYSLGEAAKCKSNFRADLLKDLEEIEKFDLPPIPLHLSNSTDAFQPIETEIGNTLFALQQFAKYRKRFSRITILTKNPAIPAREEYLYALKSLLAGKNEVPLLIIECSLAFWNDHARKTFDPAAPDVESRKNAMRTLSEAGIPVSLRIDPLFPRNPLSGGKTMADFGLEDVQPLADLESLVTFAEEIGAYRVIYSILKITKPRFGPLSDEMQQLLTLYRHLAGEKQVPFRGNSWRIPDPEAILRPFLEICDRYGMTAKACKDNLLETF